MEKQINSRIINKIDTTDNWNSSSLILKDGELGIEKLSDGTNKIKIGNGIDTWSALEYYNDNETFFATFGTTTNAEIEEAYQSGKMIYCIESASIASLTKRRSATEHEFLGGYREKNGNYMYHFYVWRCVDDVWSIESFVSPTLPEYNDRNKFLKVDNSGVPVWESFEIENDVFTVWYNSTTFADVEAAYTSGKFCLCVNSYEDPESAMAWSPLTSLVRGADSNRFIFVDNYYFTNSVSQCRFYVLDDTDTWSVVYSDKFLPEATVSDAGKVLSIDSSGKPEWVEQQASSLVQIITWEETD